MRHSVYDDIVAESGDAIVEVARRRFITAEYLSDTMGWTTQAATAVLRRLVKAGRLHRSGGHTSFSGYRIGRVTYWARREGSSKMAPYDIVGYTYRADIFCPNCIVEQMHWTPLSDRANAETALDDIAHVAGIDRMDEGSFDSGEFPKVVFRDQLRRDDHCGQCRQLLSKENE